MSYLDALHEYVFLQMNMVCSVQKQLSRGVIIKRCSESIQQIYRGKLIPRCVFNKVVKICSKFTEEPACQSAIFTLLKSHFRVSVLL